MITKSQEERIDRHAEALHTLATETKSNLIVLMIGNMEGEPRLKLVHVAYCTTETRAEISGRPDAVAAILHTCRTANAGVELVEDMQRSVEGLSDA